MFRNLIRAVASFFGFIRRGFRSAPATQPTNDPRSLSWLLTLEDI
jgi:hypothetical protein